MFAVVSRWISLVTMALLLGQSAYAKGVSGSYTLSGKAYDENKELLINEAITVKFRGDLRTIHTNDKGEYELSIPFGTPCKSGVDQATYKRLMKSMNPKIIGLTCKGVHIEVENQWRQQLSNTMGSRSREIDLIFK